MVINVFLSAIRASAVLVLLSTLLLGIGYPMLVLGVAQTLFHYQANGSMIERAEKPVGSMLIGQEFSSPKYFWGRLSATTPAYNPQASAGSNFSPNNPHLLDAANARIAELQKADPKNRRLIPVELVTASGSGLDPHLSVAAVEYQTPRVAKARGMKQEEVEELVRRSTKSPGFGVFGVSYVNVLRLNMALDERSAK